MKISGNGDIAKYISETAVNKNQDATQRQAVNQDTQLGRKDDTVVNLSQKSKDVQAAQKAVNAQPDIRAEKVQSIVDKIKDGTYVVDHEKTAEKMMQAFFEEMA